MKIKTENLAELTAFRSLYVHKITPLDGNTYELDLVHVNHKGAVAVELTDWGVKFTEVVEASFVSS